MDGATGDLNFTADALAASLEELLSSSAPSTPGSVSDNEDVRCYLSLRCYGMLSAAYVILHQSRKHCSCLQHHVSRSTWKLDKPSCCLSIQVC